MKRPGSASDPFWYKDAVIYQVHVRTFFDSNGDGIGDFPGLTAKLDYIQRLGISCIWLLPFYPSPLKDDGYDIAHYEGVHPSYGTLKDFKTFLREAHERGLQVITELVINHTSDQHPWFQSARKAPPDSPKREYYVWSDTPDRYPGVRIIFADTEHSNWTWDPEAKAYYWHRFFTHQPDLNFDNPRVRRAVIKWMKFWMDMGVDGLRLDAVPYLVERDSTICENLPETHDILKLVRHQLDERYSHRMLLAEANQWPADVRPYFGDGDECHMAFHFPLMPRLFMAVRQEDRYPITEVLRQTPPIPEGCQWATFLRNHDELTLEMVTSEERDFMWQQYAADPQMRLNQGIRRRLAPLMENDRERIELLNSLLFSLPGTPVIYYGDEIGMGDNVYLGDRNGVRTPMQWTGDRNAGFSTADPGRLYAPPVMDAVYGYQGLNVEAQERSPFSLLNWMKRMVAIRKQHQTFGRGTIEFLEPPNPRILAFIRRYENETILVVANLSRSVQPVELDLSRFDGRTPVEMLDRTDFPRIGTLPYFVTLGPYGFYWFLLQEASAAAATARVAARPAGTNAERLPALLAGSVWDQLLEGHIRTLLERDYLLSYLTAQRWFTSTVCGTPAVRIDDWCVLRKGRDPQFLLIVAIECTNGQEERYALALASASEENADAILKNAPHQVIARLTGARRGVLYEAVTDDITRILLAGVEDARTLSARYGTIQGARTFFLESIRRTRPEEAERFERPADTQNALVVAGERVVLKQFHRLDPAPSLDEEVPRHVAGPAGFGRVPRVAGTLTYMRDGRDPLALAVVHEYLAHQRNAWDHAVEEIGRFLNRVIMRGAETPPGPDIPPRSLLMLAEHLVPAEVLETVGGYVETAATIGKRVGELHLALARPPDDPRFGIAEPGPSYVEGIVSSLVDQVRNGVLLLNARVEQIPAAIADEAYVVMHNEAALVERLRSLGAAAGEVPTIRIHGDLHLGQVLLHQGDALFIDFEGDPARPLAERLAHHCALRDVAGLIQSFRYAALAGLVGYTATRPGDVARLEPWARFWHVWASVIGLRAYRNTVRYAAFEPKEPARFEALLKLFLAEQAVRELDNELRYRPEWLRVPLRTLAGLMRAPDVPVEPLAAS